MEEVDQSDKLAPARGFLVAFAFSVVFWGLIIGATWLWRSTSHTQTVPAAVLMDGTNQPEPDVTAWAQDELNHISRDWRLPPYSLAVVSPMSWNGITVIAEKPVRYAVVLVRWAYPDEAAVRNVASHEAGHILISEAGLPQSETTADQFALCFGSPKAREYARSVKHMTADCDLLRRTLTTTSGAPNQGAFSMPRR